MEIQEIPALRDPVMVLAFTGWSDAGEAATGVISHLLNHFKNPTLIGEINSEDFYDFQVNRPLIYIDEALVRSITWPGVQIFGVANPTGDRDFIFVRGVEPSMRWRTFATEILDLADDLEVNLIVTLGSMLADTPHSRSTPVTGTAAHPEMAARLRVETSRYEGPTGILGVIVDGCISRGIDASSLWAAVPHYAGASPSPKATLALINSLEDFLTVSLPQADLPEQSQLWVENVTNLVAEDSDLQEYISGLESTYDANDLPEESGEELAREVERYLRRQNSSDSDS